MLRHSPPSHFFGVVDSLPFMTSFESLPGRQSSKPQPLYIRLYFEPHLTEVVLLLGYQGLPEPDFAKAVSALVEKYGRDKVMDATSEITEADRSTKCPVIRLTQA